MRTRVTPRVPVTNPALSRPVRTMFVMGTRPEAIKLAPVILGARADKARFESTVISTGQHKEMLQQALGIFGLTPDYSLLAFKKGVDLCQLTSRIVDGIGSVLKSIPTDVLVVHGDTTTAMAAALAASCHNLPVAHVEAGLRAYGNFAPFPEENNRRIIAHVADVHFAPTTAAVQNLLRENIPISDIVCTGNTVIDALRIASMSPDTPEILQELPKEKHLLLVTSHRRENIGDPLRHICAAVKKLAERNGDVLVVWPMHKNPLVREIIEGTLSGIDNIRLIEPLDYLSFVHLMRRARFIMTDSGGIQEEAPALGKPVLVMRETTERPEAVECMNAKIVGTSEDALVESAELLLRDRVLYRKMSGTNTPFGDGQASQRILDTLYQRFGRDMDDAKPEQPAPQRNSSALVAALKSSKPAIKQERTGTAFSAVREWLMSSGIQTPITGAVFSWYDPENARYAYIYPEIMGYWMTAMTYLAESEPVGEETDSLLTSARKSGDWIIARGFEDCGGVLSRFYTRGRGKDDPFRSEQGLISAFDNGILLNGFLNLYERTMEDRYLTAARAIAAFIMEKMAPPDGRIQALYSSKRDEYVEHSMRWSCFPGSFLSKVAIAMMHMNRVAGDPAYSDCADRLCANSLKYQEPDTGRFVLLDGSTYTHPHCYTAEGLLSAGKLLGNGEYMDAGLAGVRWLLQRAEKEGYVRRNYESNVAFPEAVSSDIQAQAIRLFYLAKAEAPEMLTFSSAARRLMLFMLSFQNTRKDNIKSYGGFRYGTDTRTGKEINTYNSWASMFAMQAMMFSLKGLAGYTPFMLI